MNHENETPQMPGAQCLCGGKGPAVTDLLQVLLGSGAAAGHFRNAGVEVLKGLREVIDSRIESLSRQAPQEKGTRVSVD